MSSQTYKLDLDPPKRNVFVTQLHQREDEDEDIVQIPVVKESADRLIETGIRTLQKTLLLKKEVEVEQVDAELAEKRNEFRRRMEACAERQIEVQKKQQKMKDRVAKFEKFIKENEAKRTRAIQKYHGEVKLKEQKTTEHDMLTKQLEELKERQRYLGRKLVNYKKYEQYLLKVVENLPENYIEMTDNMITSLMMRHRTLSDTNQQLVDNLSEMTDKHEELKANLDEIKQEHNKRKVSINHQLAYMQKEQEVKTEVNQELEQSSSTKKGDFRKQRELLGTILMAIENITEQCVKKGDIPAHMLSIDDQLDYIKEHLNEQEDVHKMSLPNASNASEIQEKQSKRDNQVEKVRKKGRDRVAFVN
ncbi:coiled-coil domain-containing protein 42 homolog [Tubulanus polymorphus]|uniref:coiled-coil domain-containing protein 42 homolog n=1 Tax=Tubulanus polymorphus TaxID=672921 RepID=UPI003DA3B72D